MKKLKNKRGFTLVELLAVIVVLAIVMGLAVVGISSVLDSTRKSAFAADAKSYIDGARQLVRADEANVLMGGTSSYTPKCNGATSSASKTIAISKIILDSGGKSPFTGAAYTEGSVKVTCTWTSSSYAKYTYAVFLSDGTWAVEKQWTSGTLALKTPLEEDNVNSSAVKKLRTKTNAAG